MIPADSITFNDDGTAWWVVRKCPEPRGQQSMHTDCNVGATILDQPCDTCGGEGVVDDLDNDGAVVTCEWCDGTGRHTFEIEVECQWNTRAMNDAFPEFPKMDSPRILRVHVLDALPIYGGYKTRPVGHIWINSDGDAWHHDVNESKIVTLPPAAKPGMWAVKLEVHDV
jgi:hypothetical protein